MPAPPTRCARRAPAFAIWVILIDIAKGWVAARRVARPRAARRFRRRQQPQAAWLPALCAFAAILGHVFPVWHGFRGGKGVATLVGAFAGIELALLLPLFAELARRGHGLGFRRSCLDHRRAAPSPSIY